MRNTPYINDGYTKEAKRTGFRARSVFKLKEIQEKYKLIKPGDFVLDFGSAPGSFLQYLSKIVGLKGFVLGIDKRQIEEINENNIKFIKSDLDDLDPREIKSIIEPKKQHFDVITADLAPKTSGVKEVDQGLSVELNEKVIELSKELLKKNGIIITKIFQSADSDSFINEIKSGFKSVKRFKPKASRKESQEIFLILRK